MRLPPSFFVFAVLLAGFGSGAEGSTAYEASDASCLVMEACMSIGEQGWATTSGCDGLDSCAVRVEGGAFASSPAATRLRHVVSVGLGPEVLVCGQERDALAAVDGRALACSGTASFGLRVREASCGRFRVLAEADVEGATTLGPVGVEMTLCRDAAGAATLGVA